MSRSADPKHQNNVAYHASMRELLTMMEQKAKTDDARAHVIKAQSMMRIANQISPYEVIDKSLPFFVKYNNQIGDRDEEFFVHECGKLATAETDPAVASLMLAVRDMYLKSNQTDKDRAYDLLVKMRDVVIQYGIAAAS